MKMKFELRQASFLLCAHMCGVCVCMYICIIYIHIYINQDTNTHTKQAATPVVSVGPLWQNILISWPCAVKISFDLQVVGVGQPSVISGMPERTNGR